MWKGSAFNWIFSISAGLWPEHILYLTKELRDRHRHCRPDPDDRRGGGHHDPRVQEEEKESLDHRVLDLQRPVHQHRLQPQQHQSEELSVTSLDRNNQELSWAQWSQTTPIQRNLLEAVDMIRFFH